MEETPMLDAATPVTIYGRTYRLRGSGQTRYLQELADEVDRRMREVADATGTADTMKVAILAALNIMDDCLQARSQELSGSTRERLERMVERIDDVLAGPPDTPRRADEVGGES